MKVSTQQYSRCKGTRAKPNSFCWK